MLSALLSAAEISYNRDVRPVLSDNCFFCHGPDKQSSDLRLDLSDVAREKGAIAPGEPGKSELIARITSQDPDYQMPPPDSNRNLSHSSIQTLEQWVWEGARYEKHWAFEPPRKRPTRSPGEISKWAAGWCQTIIDLRVAQRLASEGMTPSPAADPERLLRRVTLDLTGLPPTIDQLDALLNGTQEQAYETHVDALLASPSFGEHFALPWLDLARYADTYGYDNDREMHLWPWRDWLIDALNKNLPYSDFIRWQLAGDLLPNPTQNQRLATTFNRLHRQNAEGGALPEEFIIEYVADRTQTFATAFMGITLKCARCHDHKFDPISQKDYYALTAYFNNIDEAGVYAEKTGATPTPNIFLYADGEEFRHRDLKSAIRKAEAQLERAREQARTRFGAWHTKQDSSSMSHDPKPLQNLAFEDRSGLPGSATLAEGPRGLAVYFSGDEGIQLGHKGAFERTESFSMTLWVHRGKTHERMVLAHNSKPNWEAGSRGWEMILDHGRLEFGLSHFWPGNALRVRSRDPLPEGQWTHVAITYDGSSRARGITLYFNGNPLPSEIIRDHLYDTVRFQSNPPPTVLGARRSELGFRGGGMDEFSLYQQCLSAHEVRRLQAKNPIPHGLDGLRNHYVDRVDPEVRGAREHLKEARDAENQFVGKLRSIMVMHDKQTPAEARVLQRGAYDLPGESVKPGLPLRIAPAHKNRPQGNRLDLVDWLTSENHPLTARIVVNRIWANFFGRGLVETEDDFGNQGSLPSHPALLDDLAIWFIESGWDVKGLCRLIVTSATYQQDSAMREDALERDPDNRLLARGPRHRMKAEQLRDVILASCGLLSTRVGGPSVKPYQPAGLWRETGPQTYQSDSGEKRYRRSLYTFWKRTAPPPSMLSFDAVSREVCVARRASTTTPSQSLILWNDPQFVEAARVLAMTLLPVGGDRADFETATKLRISTAFRLLLARAPDQTELRELQEAFTEQLQHYQEFPGAASAYSQVGPWPVNPKLDPHHLAAMTAVIQLLINLHEFQMKL